MARKPDLREQTGRISGFHPRWIMNGHMPAVLDSFRFVLVAVAEWMNQSPASCDRVPARRESCPAGSARQRRLRLNDDHRGRLAAKAKGLGRKLLAEVATIVTPETLLHWHRSSSLRNTMAAASAAPVVPARPVRLRSWLSRANRTATGGRSRRIEGGLSNLGHNRRGARLLTFLNAMVLNRHRTAAARVRGRSFWRNTGI
jgi:hypothetical protein